MGELVLRRFRIERKLGSGGFGTVFRAWDERLRRPVALKTIEAGRAGSRRVLREAQAAARLNHPGIVTLYELGEEGGCAYLVSELVEGETVDALAREGMLSDRDVAEIGAELGDALEHAHARGVVHRDIKPHNVLVAARSGRAKLMDFGVARLEGAEALTATGDVVGTIAYMAPEQADGARCGPATDTYSLALTLYECWAGANPVLRATPAATARAIGSAVPSLADARPDLPPDLVDAIDASLAADPAARPPLARVAAALVRTAPSLDDARAVPRPHGPRLVALASLVRGGAPAATLTAAATAALALAVLFSAPVAPPAWACALALACGIAAIALPRLAFVLAAAGSVAWLAAAADEPGAALVCAALAAPVPALLPRDGRCWCLPALAPALGAVGLAPLYLGIAGLAAPSRRRAALAALGYLWLTVAEVALGRTLLLGRVEPAGAGWERSAGDAVSSVLLPLADPVVPLGLALWIAAALALGALVRGRIAILDLLGALLWSAAVLAAHRLIAPHSAVLPPAWLGAGLLALVALSLAQRALGGPATDDPRRHALPSEGEPATLA